MKFNIYSVFILLAGYFVAVGVYTKCNIPQSASEGGHVYSPMMYHHTEKNMFSYEDYSPSSSKSSMCPATVPDFNMQSVSTGLERTMPSLHHVAKHKRTKVSFVADDYTVLSSDVEIKNIHGTHFLPLLAMNMAYKRQPFSQADMASVGSEATIAKTTPHRVKPPGGGSGSGTFNQPVGDIPIVLMMLFLGMYLYWKRTPK